MKRGTRAGGRAVPADDAKGRLVKAAAAIFARYGYEGASTRMLASAAKVNLSAIPYYFGGKEGLYHEVVKMIVDFGREKIFPEISRISKRLESGNPSRKELVGMMESLLCNYVRLVTSEETAHIAPIMFQEQLRPTKAFRIFYGELLSHEHRLCSALAARLLKLPTDSKEAAMHAHALLGQVFVFLAGRALILKRIGADKFSAEDAALLDKVIRKHVRMMFR